MEQLGWGGDIAVLGGANMISFGLDLIFAILAIIAFGMTVWALVHAIRTPANAFVAAGKLQKKWWLLILGLGTLFSFATAWGYFGASGLARLNIFAIASVIAAGVYLADVKPAVTGMGKGGNNGPYGPW
ncbi:hypothetical protein GCM10020219_057610 [Nonomuraea dietziae]